MRLFWKVSLRARPVLKGARRSALLPIFTQGSTLVRRCAGSQPSISPPPSPLGSGGADDRLEDSTHAPHSGRGDHRRTCTLEPATAIDFVYAQCRDALQGGPRRSETVVASMPGVISTLAVVRGQQVVAGDVLLSIEAMKMETALHAEADGVIAEVLVKPGDQIDAKDLLIRFE
ncbi:MAG: biotin/lipoyl-containing protein [Thiobacillus sp.]|uniref:biotin/lipoyl-containing protein n=1 Tax=Thiobacillus sp. TaxID=924 RepID=UPI00289389AE|nr:biotin/lipoyl-containing protein [Thiobacillus sp.]MDT3707343.1 biotin/lipoyl-containing protein [Thiobacillus sp.]